MITLGGDDRISVENFQKVVIEREKVRLDPSAVDRVLKNHEFLKDYAKDKVIYGINTGLGPMAQFKINEADQHRLQYNLIRSHASGAGALFSEELSRATMLSRIGNLIQGKSGVHPNTIQLLCDMLNNGVSACIFEKGGVGASGDLVQLAHLALNMIGEGEVLVDGNVTPTQQALSEKGIYPMEIHLREGLAIMNGTSAMTGVGMINLIKARKALEISVALSTITNELMKSFDDHFSVELNDSKLHAGQRKVAEMMRTLLVDSKLIRKRPDHLYHRKFEEAVFTDKVQEYYSLRCVPQILGPIYETVLHAEDVLINEVNSVSDNPVIDHENEMVYHGGNFHGDYISLEMDKLKIVMAKLSMLSERQLNYLLNDKLNQKLPPFVNLGKLGLNFGMQGLQFTATSTTAENQTLSFPMYIHSIPNNNDNQDIVSMGTNAALLTKKVIDNTVDVLSIQTITLLQAIDYLNCQSRLSSFTHRWYTQLRAILPTILEDKPLYQSIQQVRKFIINFNSGLKF